MPIFLIVLGIIFANALFSVANASYPSSCTSQCTAYQYCTTGSAVATIPWSTCDAGCVNCVAQNQLPDGILGNHLVTAPISAVTLQWCPALANLAGCGGGNWCCGGSCCTPVNGTCNSWSACSVSCQDESGTQSCTSSTGPSCCGSAAPSSQGCNGWLPNVDGHWTGWSGCSQTCNGTQTRSCVGQQCGGAGCSGASSRSCNPCCTAAPTSYYTAPEQNSWTVDESSQWCFANTIQAIYGDTGDGSGAAGEWHTPSFEISGGNCSPTSINCTGACGGSGPDSCSQGGSCNGSRCCGSCVATSTGYVCS